MREMVGGCCVCSDDRGWSENPLVYCDGQSCTVAVHQACYGIVTVPTGPWYCRKCESQERSVKVKCELCPSKYGALKRTDNGGWAHVVCALYIPEVRFGNVTTMEPIQLQLIPTERFNKVCYICEEKGKAANATVGACMQCNKAGCKQQFHVTCAQSLGLLCEEAGNYLDNVKYCGYCQHHYSKLKKGGNVKTIPPYKPISSENHLSDSNSEKEVDGVSSKTNSKRKTSSGSSSKGSSKTGSSTKSGSSTTTTTTPSNSAQPKTVHNNTNNINNNNNNNSSSSNNNNKSSDKTKVSSNSSSSSSSTTTSSKSAKIDDSAISTTETPLPIVDNKPDVKDSKEIDQKNDISSNGTNSTSNLNNNNNNKDVKSSKKRKTHSRTPTPVGLVLSEGVSVVTSTPNSVIESTQTTTTSDKKTIGEVIDKPKKAKVETTQSILTNQPVVALTSISTIKSISHTSSSSSSVVSSASIPTTSSTTTTGNDVISDITTTSTTSTTTTVTTHQSIIQSGPAHSVNSLVVSVPLTSTSLSPHTHIINNQTSVVTPTPNHHLESVIQSSNHHHHHHTILPSEMSNGGFLKNYDKHDAVTTEVDMELEVSPPIQDLPAMKRSHSVEKPEKPSGRGKKKLSNANGVISQLNTTIPITTTTTTTTTTKRGGSNAGRTSQTATPSPTGGGGVFSNISQSQLKDSPPSSPGSESTTISQTTTASTSGRGRSKNRKSAPAAVTATTTTTTTTTAAATTPGSPKDTKDVKLFQNGVTAPHMLGNQLNPNSNMAQKMSDHLNSELEAHSIYNPSEAAANMVGPQLHHRVIASARASSSGASSTASGGSGFSSMLSGGGGNIPQTLDQLLERQWEQGSQFLMEQAQHFDIASLLSCLHQLRAENLRLEEHVSSLLQRRDHLLAVNARLAIPLTGQPATPQSTHPHTVNNIHPAVGASHSDIAARTARHSLSSANYQHPVAGQVVENGLPAAEPAYHRSPAPQQQPPPPPQLQQVPPQQPSPSMRHSPAAGAAYPPTGAMLRQNTEASGRAVATSRPQPYQLYQTPGTSSQQQMVIRRDSDMHYQTSKPS